MSQTLKRGLFLDLDGTLADSLPVLRRVYDSFLAQFGVASSVEEFELLNGPPLPQIVAYLKRTHHLADSEDELLSNYHALIRQHQENVAPAAGATMILERAFQCGWKTAVVTSSNHQSTQDWLERHQLLPYISLIVGGDDVSRGKPDPEPYLTAIQKLHVDPVQSFAVEDSVQGASAACAAGLPTRVLYPAVLRREEWPPEVQFIQSLTDLNELL